MTEDQDVPFGTVLLVFIFFVLPLAMCIGFAAWRFQYDDVCIDQIPEKHVIIETKSGDLNNVVSTNEFLTTREASSYIIKNYAKNCKEILVSDLNFIGSHPLECYNEDGTYYRYEYENQPSYCRTSILVKHQGTEQYSGEDLSHIFDCKNTESDLIG